MYLLLGFGIMTLKGLGNACMGVGEIEMYSEPELFSLSFLIYKLKPIDNSYWLIITFS